MKYTDIELKNEKWKDIFGYDGMYQVSDFGRVRSLKYGKTRVMRTYKNNNGYLLVNLYKNGKRKHLSVHRLVASAFIENDNLFNTEVNHINEDKTDNREVNLEWCDRRYNSTYNNIRRRCKQHKRYKRNAIKDLYDPNLSYRQNLKIFRANGIGCSISTVHNLCKDLGLINQRQGTKERF